MDNTMGVDITPIVNLFLNFLLFFIGLDFAWCGYWLLKTNEFPRLPRLLGYLVFRIFETANRKNKSKNEIANSMFSMKAASIYLFFGGLQLIVFSTLKILIELSNKTLP